MSYHGNMFLFWVKTHGNHHCSYMSPMSFIIGPQAFCAVSVCIITLVVMRMIQVLVSEMVSVVQDSRSYQDDVFPTGETYLE